MPEGHVVHRLARAFADKFVGQQVDASSPQGRFRAGAAILDGRVLEHAEAHGKQMFLRFSDDAWLRVHLGLYGMWRFFGPGLQSIGRRHAKPAQDMDVPPPPRDTVRLRLLTQRHVADLSGPTACELLDPSEKAAAAAKLGEDPLRPDADPARAYAKLHASRTALGQLLMRQDIVAGIGNIYRAEILFRARLNPHAPGSSLEPGMWQILWDDLACLLGEGVRIGRIVTTGGPDRPPSPGWARRGETTYVAHRAGKPCLVCGNPVLVEPMAGRSLYWCATCQTG